DTADGAIEVHATALGGEIRVGPVREVLDGERASVDQIAAELTHVRLDGAIAIGLCVALPPAIKPVTGLHLHEQPVLVRSGIDEKRPDALDLHVVPVSNAQTTTPTAATSRPGVCGWIGGKLCRLVCLLCGLPTGPARHLLRAVSGLHVSGHR